MIVDDEEWNLYNSLLNADDDIPFFNVEEIEELLNKMDKEVEELLKEAANYQGDRSPKVIKCECGAEKCKLPSHSDWCPKHKL